MRGCDCGQVAQVGHGSKRAPVQNGQRKISRHAGQLEQCARAAGVQVKAWAVNGSRSFCHAQMLAQLLVKLFADAGQQQELRQILVRTGQQNLFGQCQAHHRQAHQLGHGGRVHIQPAAAVGGAQVGGRRDCGQGANFRLRVLPHLHQRAQHMKELLAHARHIAQRAHIAVGARAHNITRQRFAHARQAHQFGQRCRVQVNPRPARLHDALSPHAPASSKYTCSPGLPSVFAKNPKKPSATLPSFNPPTLMSFT